MQEDGTRPWVVSFSSKNGRVLTFHIEDGAVGTQVGRLTENERERGVGLSSLPDVPGGV